MERKLVAILSADVVGYTRLMEIDEEGTFERLKSLRKRLIDPCIAAHGGRTVKLMGDGALVEFSSVVDAVSCAVAIQRDVSADEPERHESRIQFRIGINVGDVIIDGDDIYGEGVNVAARLQGLAEPGGVAVSAAVRQHIGSKLAVGFEDFGEHSVKNLEKSVRVYITRPGSVAQPSDLVAVTRSATPADKLSIAVLPFVNMSSDSEQEYFADGITEDILTELTRFKSLFVIARNSAFRYKGQSPKIQDVGRDLGVRWAVEGSVRKLGGRVRVTAQLLDAATGAHIWAERFDRSLEDILEVQDEVVRAIAAAIPGHVERAATEHMRRKPPANWTAFDQCLKGRWAYHHSDDFNEIVEHLTKAIEADPSYAPAHALLAQAYAYSIYFTGTDPETAIARGAYHAACALKLDAGNSEVHAVAASNYILSGNHELADFHSRRGLELNPNDPNALVERGLVLSYLGHQPEAMEMYDRARKLDPNMRESRNEPLCDCLFMQGKYNQVIDIIRLWHEVPTHVRLVEAATQALLGHAEDSKKAMDIFHRTSGPKPDPKTMVKYQMRMLARQEDRDRWLDGYRKAGLDV